MNISRNRPFKTATCVVRCELDAQRIAVALIRRSAWFELTPLCDDQWEFTTKMAGARPEQEVVFPSGTTFVPGAQVTARTRMKELPPLEPSPELKPRVQAAWPYKPDGTPQA